MLVTPPFKDGQAPIVTGAEAMNAISGYGRDENCSEILPRNPGNDEELLGRRERGSSYML